MSKIKRLYLIDVFYVFGGAERNLYDIVKHIDKDKFAPYIYAEILDIQRIYSPKGIKSMFKLARFAKAEKIDIIVSYHE